MWLLCVVCGDEMKKKGEGWEGERGCHARLIVSKHEALEVIRQAMPDLGRERD